jgi:hypothetical protein
MSSIGRKKEIISQSLAIVLVFLFSGGCVLMAFPEGFFKISNYTWALEGDTAAGLLGWLFFRTAEWTFPLGYISQLLEPIGTRLGFTDAIPWVAIVFKLFSPFLPDFFQYSGLWILLCIFLQALFGYLLFYTALGSKRFAVLGACLLLMSPAWYFRLIHLALFSHWLLLCAFWLYLKRSRQNHEMLSRWPWFLLIIISAGVHPYLAVMVLALSFAEPIYHRFFLRSEGNRLFFSKVFMNSFVCFLTFYVLGYIERGQPVKETAFGDYSSNLNSLINSLGRTPFWIPGFAMGSDEYEGFAYLGCGLMMLALVASVLFFVKRKELLKIGKKEGWRYGPLILICLFLSFYAYSPQFRLGETSLVNLTILYTKWFKTIVDSFRASGRFIWPIHYLIIFASVVTVCRVIKNRWIVTGLLLIVLVVQIKEVRAFIPQARLYTNDYKPLVAEEWSMIAAEYKHIQLFPPLTNMIHERCVPHQKTGNYYIPFAFFAAQNRMGINSAYVARPKKEKIIEECNKQRRDFEQGFIDPYSVVVVSEEYREKFDGWMEKKALCRVLDGYYVCVDSQRESRFVLKMKGKVSN